MAGRFRRGEAGKRCRVKKVLCIAVCLEALYLTAAGAGFLKGPNPLFGISRESGEWIFPDGMGQQENAPGNVKEKGITFDLKNGRVELWKKEQSLQKGEQEN